MISLREQQAFDLAKAMFEESAHPRDRRGRFTGKGGGGTRFRQAEKKGARYADRAAAAADKAKRLEASRTPGQESAHRTAAKWHEQAAEAYVLANPERAEYHRQRATRHRDKSRAARRATYNEARVAPSGWV